MISNHLLYSISYVSRAECHIPKIKSSVTILSPVFVITAFILLSTISKSVIIVSKRISHHNEIIFFLIFLTTHLSLSVPI
ncbi:MAG: hypothetical protein Q8S84_06725 [bacterium]|nr:hypothetical protein [bacterium]